MAKAGISESVASLALPIVEEAGCELVDVEFVKEGGSFFLRIYIDKPGGVTLDDCERVSRPLSEILDEKEPIQHAYYMEVSSPGLERPLKKPRDFEKAIGAYVEVRLFKAVNQTKRFEGVLVSYDGKTLAIKTDADEILSFEADQLAKVKRIVKF